MFRVNGVDVESTYCEAFSGLVTRVLVTARSEKRLEKAAYGSTALPLTVFDESEAGVETWLDSDESIDNRRGAVLQFWVNKGAGVDKLVSEFAKRVRQGVLVVPGTRLFDFNEFSDSFSTMEKIGHCGDGYEWVEKRFGRRTINVPIMMGEFLIEEEVGYKEGVMGGNIWLFCDSYKSGIRAGEAALSAVNEVDGVVAPFGICSAGSKVETNFPDIGPTTNHRFCPTLRDKISDSKVPSGINSIPEIVINGVNLESVKEAMRKGIKKATDVQGCKKISAGNFGGDLGSNIIELEELF